MHNCLDSFALNFTGLICACSFSTSFWCFISFLLQTTFEDVFPAEATSVEEYLQQVFLLILPISCIFQQFVSNLKESMLLAYTVSVMTSKPWQAYNIEQHIQSFIWNTLSYLYCINFVLVCLLFIYLFGIISVPGIFNWLFSTWAKYSIWLQKICLVFSSLPCWYQHAFAFSFVHDIEWCLDHFLCMICHQVHEMAMVSAVQEAQKDNLRSFNDYMLKVLEVSTKWICGIMLLIISYLEF